MKDHWERLAAKKYVYSIKTVVNCKTTIPTSTSLQSGVYGKQSKKEKDKNANVFKRCCKGSSFQSKQRTWKTVCMKYFSTIDCITDMSYVLSIKT